jgi:hypothetical protein
VFVCHIVEDVVLVTMLVDVCMIVEFFVEVRKRVSVSLIVLVVNEVKNKFCLFETVPLEPYELSGPFTERLLPPRESK